jgi:hypothetical protein
LPAEILKAPKSLLLLETVQRSSQPAPNFSSKKTVAVAAATSMASTATAARIAAFVVG